MNDTKCNYCDHEHELDEVYKMASAKPSGISLNCPKCGLKTNFRISKRGYVRSYHSVELPRYYTSIMFRRTTYSAYQSMLINNAYEKYHKP